MAFTSFPPRQPFASTRLPLTLMTLDDWALATITGVDSEKYIQGQVTADVSQMTEHQHLLAAHCDAKGKMWSNLRLFRQGDGFAWLERRSLRDAQLTELKKYFLMKIIRLPSNLVYGAKRNLWGALMMVFIVLASSLMNKAKFNTFLINSKQANIIKLS